VSWAAYPCIFLVSPEGFGSLGTNATTLAYGIANLGAVNALAATCWWVLSVEHCRKVADLTASDPASGVETGNRNAAVMWKTKPRRGSTTHSQVIMEAFGTVHLSTTPPPPPPALVPLCQQPSSSNADLRLGVYPIASASLKRSTDELEVPSTAGSSASSMVELPLGRGPAAPPHTDLSTTAAQRPTWLQRTFSPRTQPNPPSLSASVGEQQVSSSESLPHAVIAVPPSPPRQTPPQSPAASSPVAVSAPAPVSAPMIDPRLFSAEEAEVWSRRMAAAHAATVSGDTGEYRGLIAFDAPTHDRLHANTPSSMKRGGSSNGPPATPIRRALSSPLAGTAASPRADSGSQTPLPRSGSKLIHVSSAAQHKSLLREADGGGSKASLSRPPVLARVGTWTQDAAPSARR
jgi:hypothetical protein